MCFKYANNVKIGFNFLEMSLKNKVIELFPLFIYGLNFDDTFWMLFKKSIGNHRNGTNDLEDVLVVRDDQIIYFVVVPIAETKIPTVVFRRRKQDNLENFSLRTFTFKGKVGVIIRC